MPYREATSRLAPKKWQGGAAYFSSRLPRDTLLAGGVVAGKWKRYNDCLEGGGKVPGRKLKASGNGEVEKK